MRIIPFWTEQLQTLSLYGSSYAHLVPFLILLNCSLLLAANIANYGARIKHFFSLCHWQARCQHLNWFFIFPVIQQHLGSGLLDHQITSIWILAIQRLISLLDFQNGIRAAAHASLDMECLISHTRTALLIPLPLYVILMGGDICCGSAWIRFMIFWINP